MKKLLFIALIILTITIGGSAMAIKLEDSYKVITWDLSDRLLQVDDFGKEGENGKGFKIYLLQGSAVVTPTTETLRMYFYKSGGDKVYLDAELSDGIFIVKCTNEVYSSPGQVKAELHLNVNGKWRISNTFEFTAYPNLIDGSVESSNEFISLQNALEKADNLEKTYAPRLTNIEASKADKAYVDMQISNVGSASPKGTYATLDDLENAYPNGTAGIYVITADGNWYFWDGTEWVSGGTYQSTGIAKGSITPKEISFIPAYGLPSLNLFDKDAVEAGYYVNYLDGGLVGVNGVNASNFIKVIAGKQYTIQCPTRGIVEQLAFYNASKAYVGGFSGASSGISVITIPANASYVRLTVADNELNTLMISEGNQERKYEAFNSFAVDTTKIRDKSIPLNTIDGKIIEAEIGKNLFLKDAITADMYVNYLSGTLVSAAGVNASDYISVNPETQYTISHPYRTIEQFAYYDSDKSFLSGEAVGAHAKYTITTPANASYIRVSVVDADLNTYQIEKGSVATKYEPGAYKISSSKIRGGNTEQKNIITVGEVGCDYTSLREAIESITNASAHNPYEVQIHEGVYDIMSYYTNAEIDLLTFIGLQIPDHVSLKGIGNKKNIILKGELNATFSPETRARASTLAVLGTSSLENLTVTAYYLRYAVHDDYEYYNLERYVKNCDFIHYGHGYASAYGEGFRSGSKYIYEDCYFYTVEGSLPYSTHSNVDFTSPTSHKFINCVFEKGNATNGDCIRFGSMGSGQLSTIELVGNKLCGSIRFEETIPGAGCDFKLIGYGNTQVPVYFEVTDGEQYVYDFVGETRKMYNGGVSIISKGTLVKLNSAGSVINAFTVSDTIVNYFGIAMEDINPGARGMVKIGGYLNVSDTNLTSVAIGDKIGIYNGELSKVSNSDYIGIVKMANSIELIQCPIESKTDLATIDTQTGTAIQSQYADDSIVELTIEGATQITKANPSLEISPDNVAVITSVGDAPFDVVSCGKNLFDQLECINLLTSGICTLKMYGKPNTQYTLSTNIPLNASAGANVFIGTNSSLNTTSNGVSISANRTITTGSDGVYYVGIRKSTVQAETPNLNATNLSDGTYWIMANEGNVANSYEPYKGSNKITISYPMRSLYTDLKDVRENGEYTQRINSIVFDGSEDEVFYLQTAVGNYSKFNIKLPNYKHTTYRHYACNRFESYNAIASVEKEGFAVNDSGMMFISVLTSRLSSNTVASLKTWLSANPITVLYELATPIVTTQEQKLTSYKGITNVYTTSPLQPTMTAKFMSRLKNTHEILLAEIAKLKQAIINLGGTV